MQDFLSCAMNGAMAGVMVLVKVNVVIRNVSEDAMVGQTRIVG